MYHVSYESSQRTTTLVSHRSGRNIGHVSTELPGRRAPVLNPNSRLLRATLVGSEEPPEPLHQLPVTCACMPSVPPN